MDLRRSLEKILPVKPKMVGLDSRTGGNDGGIFFLQKWLKMVRKNRLGSWN